MMGTGYKIFAFRVQVGQNSDFKYMFDRTSTLVQAASLIVTRGVIGWHCIVLKWVWLVSESGAWREA